MSDLRQFRHFVALAEHGHYARAAEAVNLSQPALSRSIQALEGQLGCTLVEHGSRGVALTAHGRLVLEHARRLLAGHRALHNAVSQLGNLDSGELRLGGGPFPAARLLPEALAGFSSAHPRVRVALLIEDWQTLRQRLLDDAVELFVADIRELQRSGWGRTAIPSGFLRGGSTNHHDTRHLPAPGQIVRVIGLVKPLACLGRLGSRAPWSADQVC